MVPTITALVLAVAAPRLANDGAECPPYRQDLPLRCAWGYVRVELPGLMVPIGDVHSGYSAKSARLGSMFGGGAGVFRAFGGLGVAAGLRFGYAFTRQLYTSFDSFYKYVHAGPELRLGGVRSRLYAFGLVRGGYSQWREDTVTRFLAAASEWRGGHLGLGAGVWGRLGARFMVGGEVVLDLLFAQGALQETPASISLGLGAWL